MTPRPPFCARHTKRPGLLRGPGRWGAAPRRAATSQTRKGDGAMALVFGWGDYADTDLNLGAFITTPHTLSVCFMTHYNRPTPFGSSTYAGPIVTAYPARYTILQDYLNSTSPAVFIGIGHFGDFYGSNLAVKA